MYKFRKMNRYLLSVSAWAVCTVASMAQPGMERDFQISLISPLGSNGIDSHLFVNRTSVNLLGGYSLGNTVFELGGIYNVNVGYTSGVQLAGLANYSGESRRAVQIAGVANVACGGDSPFQLAGIANVADNVCGLQMAGIVNVAEHVDGVQFGLVNIAGESDGVPVGLVNIVRRNGKHEFEVSFSEVLDASVSFRLGTDSFYTIFAGGIRCIGKPLDYAAGLGFGTHVGWNGKWGNQVEIIGYAVTENGSFRNNGLNMLAQLRLPFSVEISRHFKLFAGPVFNLTVSDAGSPSVAPWRMWTASAGSAEMTGWLGLAAGVRF